MNPRKYQIIELDVAAAGNEVSIPDVTTPKLYKKITGIAFSAPAANLPELVFTNALLIDDEEIFPERFELRLLCTGQEVPPDEKFFKLNEEANNSSISGKIKDNSAALGFVAYKVRIYLRLENPTEHKA